MLLMGISFLSPRDYPSSIFPSSLTHSILFLPVSHSFPSTSFTPYHHCFLCSTLVASLSPPLLSLPVSFLPLFYLFSHLLVSLTFLTLLPLPPPPSHLQASCSWRTVGWRRPSSASPRPAHSSPTHTRCCCSGATWLSSGANWTKPKACMTRPWPSTPQESASSCTWWETVTALEAAKLN